MKLEEMTEDQILNEILKAVPEYLDRIKPDGDFNRQVCVEMVIENLRSMYKCSRGIGYYDKMIVRDIKELDTITGHFFSAITDRVAAVEMAYKKEQMEAAINKTNAEAIVGPAFTNAGFDVKVECFKYAAAISVRIVGKNWAHFQIRYKELKTEGRLDSLISAVVDLKDAAIRIGEKLFIGRE